MTINIDAERRKTTARKLCNGHFDWGAYTVWYELPHQYSWDPAVTSPVVNPYALPRDGDWARVPTPSGQNEWWRCIAVHRQNGTLVASWIREDTLQQWSEQRRAERGADWQYGDAPPGP